jgi:hypothetical protein
VREPEYCSGDDVTLEFVGRRLSFAHADFAERLGAAARRVGLTGPAPLQGGEADDLVELAASGTIAAPRTELGRRLVLDTGADAVYWLRKLVFRGAWLDQRVRAGLAEARYDEARGGFTIHADGRELPLSRDDDVPFFGLAGEPR